MARNAGTPGYPPLDPAHDRHPLRRLARDGAATGQALKWNGTSWAPGADQAGGGGGDPWPPGDVVEQTDCFAPLIYSGHTSGTGAAAEFGNNSYSVTSPLRAFGILRLSTGTTTSGMARIALGSANTAAWELYYANDGRERRVRCRLHPGAVPDGTDDYNVRVGFIERMDGTSHRIAAVFGSAYTTTNRWYLQTRRNGTETLVDSGVDVSTTTFQNVEVIVPAAGGTAQLWIDGTQVATSNTNVPTDVGFRGTVMAEIKKSAGTSARELWVDTFGHVVRGRP